MRAKAFASMVERVLKTLPLEVKEALETVQVVIKDRPDEDLLLSMDLDPEDDTLYGIYEGHGGDASDLLGDQPPLPVRDTIVVFREPLCQDFPDMDALEEQVRVTVLHEIGHHLGMDEDDMERLGYD